MLIHIAGPHPALIPSVCPNRCRAVLKIPTAKKVPIALVTNARTVRNQVIRAWFRVRRVARREKSERVDSAVARQKKEERNSQSVES